MAVVTDIRPEQRSRAVIQGTVTQDGKPLHGAYVRLLDRSGSLAAEVPTSETGAFRFFAAPGRWTVLTLAPGATADHAVAASADEVAEIAVAI